MKKLLTLLMLGGMAFGLAACNDDTTETSSSSEETTTSSQTTSSSQASSEEETTSSVTTSSSISSEESSSEEEESSSSIVDNTVTKTLDLSKLTIADLDKNQNDTDGFFTFIGTQLEAGKRIKTAGTSDIPSDPAKVDHVGMFTTTGGGTLTMSAKTGSNGKAGVIYLASTTVTDPTALTPDYTIVDAVPFSEDSSPYTDLTLEFPSAGTYLILWTENISIQAMTATWVPEATITPTSGLTIAEPNNLVPPEHFLGDYEAEELGNYTLTGAIDMNSRRNAPEGVTLPSNVGSVYAQLEGAEDNITFTPTSAGTLTIYAAGDGATGSLTISATGADDVTNALLDNGDKTLTAITTTLTANTTYTIHNTAVAEGAEIIDAYVYYITFAAI